MSQPDEPPHPGGKPPDDFSPWGMLGKLVLLPGLLVLVLVILVMLVGWLTLSPGDVDTMVDALEKRGSARWRAAVNLAGALRAPGGDALKRDPALARRLIAILRRELAAGRMRKEDVTLRVYLCRALGEFCVEEPVDVLVDAATIERDPREVDVRRSAIEALAVLASNVGPKRLRSRDDLLAALEAAAHDARPALRSAAAFALGVIGGKEAEAMLTGLLGDPYPDVRYNAATGLARHGRVECVEVLREMLDPNESAGLDVEQRESARDFKRAVILVNALRAADRLASATPSADLSRLERAIERLTRSDVEGPVRVRAVATLHRLRERRAKPEPDGREASR